MRPARYRRGRHICISLKGRHLCKTLLLLAMTIACEQLCDVLLSDWDMLSKHFRRLTSTLDLAASM